MLDIVIYNIIDLIVIIVKIHARRNQHLENFLHQVIKRLKAVTVKADLQKSNFFPGSPGRATGLGNRWQIELA